MINYSRNKLQQFENFSFFFRFIYWFGTFIQFILKTTNREINNAQIHFFFFFYFILKYIENKLKFFNKYNSIFLPFYYLVFSMVSWIIIYLFFYSGSSVLFNIIHTSWQIGIETRSWNLLYHLNYFYFSNSVR